MLYIVYSIHNRSRDKIYIGHTADLENRVKRHNGILPNKSKSFTSKNNGLWEIIHSEKFNTRKEAIIREKKLKSFRGREFIRNLIKQNEL